MRSLTRSLSHGSKHVRPAAELGRMLFSKHSFVVGKTGQSFLIITKFLFAMKWNPQVSNLKSIFHDGIDQPLLWASPASPPRLDVKSSKSRRDRTVGRRRYGSNLRLPNNDMQMGARFLMLYMGFSKLVACRSCRFYASFGYVCRVAVSPKVGSYKNVDTSSKAEPIQ